MAGQLTEWNDRDVFCVSYWAEAAPNQIPFCDAFVCVASKYGKLQSPPGVDSSEFMERDWPEPKPDTDLGGWQIRRYAVQLPSERVRELPTELSGAFARMLIAGESSPADREIAVERSVADLLLWEVAEFLDTHVAKRDCPMPIIVLRGPLSPALRGRILYRTFSQDIPFIAISHEASHVERLAATLPIPSDAQDRAQSLRWHGPFPPLAIDQGSRFFVGARRGKPLFVAEAPCCTTSLGVVREYWSERLSLCEWLFRDENIFADANVQRRRRSEQLPLVGLPFPLARASAVARSSCERLKVQELNLAIISSHYSEGYPESRTALAGVMTLMRVALEHTSGGLSQKKVTYDFIREEFHKQAPTNPELVKAVESYPEPLAAKRKRAPMTKEAGESQ